MIRMNLIISIDADHVSAWSRGAPPQQKIVRCSVNLITEQKATNSYYS